MKIIENISNEYYDKLLSHSNEFLQKNNYYKKSGILYYRVPAYGIYRKPRYLQVIPPRDKDKILKQILDDTKNKLGRDNFYYKIREKYCGISKSYAFEFLKKQEYYQLHLIQPREKVLKPMAEYAINQRFQMDHIDMSNYANPRNHWCKFVLVVIDVFSKYAYVRPQTKKTAENVLRDLKDIFEENYEITKKYPAVLQSDNAREFEEDGVQNFLKKKKVKHIFSPTYMPQANAIVERFNRTLKNGIFTNLTKQNNRYYYDILQKIVYDYNHTYHSSIKDTPVRIHKAGRINKIQQNIVEERNEKYKKSKKNYEPLNIGDKVRIHILTNAEERKNEKFAKKYVQQWSKEYYEVYKIEFSNMLISNKYVLINEGGIVLDKKYYRHDLQRINV